MYNHAQITLLANSTENRYPCMFISYHSCLFSHLLCTTNNRLVAATMVLGLVEGPSDVQLYTVWLLSTQCFHCLKHIHDSLHFAALNPIDKSTENPTSTHSVTERYKTAHNAPLDQLYITNRMVLATFLKPLHTLTSQH